MESSTSTTSTPNPSFHDTPLTVEEMEEYRNQAKIVLEQLEEVAKTSTVPSWVRSSGGNVSSSTGVVVGDDDAWLKERSDQCRFFDTHGFLVLSGFVPNTDDNNNNNNNDNTITVQALKRQMENLANNDWDPNESLDTFGTDAKSNLERGDYFLDSSNKVHYFAEPHALEETNDNNHNNQQQPQQTLKPEFQKNKLAALNKAGHGMHTIPGMFRDYTLSHKMKMLVTDLGWKDPVVPQSMYIFKQPKIGGAVSSHQDSSFLFTTPRQTCLGLWLALDDATMENGCLWVRPGSHKEPLRRQFIRNPEYFCETNNNDNNNSKTPPPSKLIFKNHHEDPNVTWEGELPPSLSEKGFIPVEVKAGDLVVFCGTLDHLSLPNFSELERHTFQLHLVEGPKEGVEWSPSNWLQYPQGASFIRLVE